MKKKINKLTLSKDFNSTDPQKRANNSASFLLENSMTRREYQSKGKEMWQLINNRKELEAKIKRLENRISHLGFEQQRTEKTIEGTKKKHESFSKIRDEVAQEKIQKNEYKKLQYRTLSEAKDKLMKERRELNEKIKENKTKIIQKNVEVKNAMKENTKIGLLMRREEEKGEFLRNKEKVVEVSESIKKIHHGRNSSFQTLRQMKEEEYTNRMQEQIKAQEEAVKRIQELERIETEFMEKLQMTQKMQETVNSILSSPTHKDINLLSFNL